MKYWEWHIPIIYEEYLTVLGLEGHPLFAEFRKVQLTPDGFLPQAFEIYPNIFLWRNHGHRMIYERLVKERILLLASLERM